MCSPIGLIAGIASAGMAFIGQGQAARAQERAQKSASELEQARYLDQVNAARVQQAQEQIARAQRIGAASRGNQLAMARARVAAGEAGVTGLSVQSLIDSMTASFARNRFSETRRAEMQDTNRDLALNDLAMRSRMNLLGINKPIQQANPLQSLVTGLQTGLSVQSAANRWNFGGSVRGAGRAQVVVDGAPRAVPVMNNAPPRPTFTPLPLTQTGGNTMLPGTGQSAVVESVDQSFMDWSLGVGQPPVQRWD